MSYFCGFAEWLTNERRLRLIFFRNHCQKFSASQILDKHWAGFKPVQNLSSDGVEWSCVVVITTAPWCHKKIWTECCQKIELNLCKLVLAVACCDLCQELTHTGIVLSFISRVKLFYYIVGEALVRSWFRGSAKCLNFVKILGWIKHSGRHDMLTC